MHKAECPREQELIDALQSAGELDATLRAHTDGCPACADLLMVMSSLLDQHHVLVREASVPSSAIVWWRAQMRSRREAAARAAQPISFMQGVALACAAGLLATALGIFVPTFRRSLSWIASTAGTWSGLSLPAVTESLASPIVLAGVAAVSLCALVLPLALYFAFHED